MEAISASETLLLVIEDLYLTIATCFVVVTFCDISQCDRISYFK